MFVVVGFGLEIVGEHLGCLGDESGGGPGRLPAVAVCRGRFLAIELALHVFSDSSIVHHGSWSRFWG